MRLMSLRDCAGHPTTRRRNGWMRTHRHNQSWWILMPIMSVIQTLPRADVSNRNPSPVLLTLTGLQPKPSKRRRQTSGTSIPTKDTSVSPGSRTSAHLGRAAYSIRKPLCGHCCAMLCSAGDSPRPCRHQPAPAGATPSDMRPSSSWLRSLDPNATWSPGNAA